MIRKLSLTLGACALLAGGVAALAPAQFGAAGAETAAAAAMPAEIADMTLGSADAPVEVIEYASYTCPHCASFHDEVLTPLKRDYIDTGKVRFVYREVYFDRPGLWAAMVARCGGEMRYFGISDMLFEKQREWIGDGKPATIADNLRKIGRTAGLSDGQLDTCLSDADMAQAMVAHYEKNANADKIEGTPSLVIDGKLHSNMSYDALKEILDEKLAE